MRFLALVLSVTALAAPAFREVTPGYRYQFPRDHFDHPEFRTEWWYYTGNVHTAAGHRYGFELVFFRQAEHRGAETNPSAWRVDDIYLAHLALTDIDGKRFRYYHRLNRAGPGIAGINFEEGRIWNGNWQTEWNKASGIQTLSAVADGIRFRLRLAPRTLPIIHGQNGISRKAAGEGKASYYVSFPLLHVQGLLNGTAVTGTAWMDHEWFTHQLSADQRGWDWFSVQLDNDTELMLFQLRHNDGSIDPYSSGTFVARSGRAIHLTRSDFELQPLEYWSSTKTGARYPVRWRISVPRLAVSIECRAAFPDQELATGDAGGDSYWEGAVEYSGTHGGVGYLEMTGYAKPVRL
jgi:predicted secreted hydrolase